MSIVLETTSLPTNLPFRQKGKNGIRTRGTQYVCFQNKCLKPLSHFPHKTITTEQQTSFEPHAAYKVNDTHYVVKGGRL